jgi:hypothetical protein
MLKQQFNQSDTSAGLEKYKAIVAWSIVILAIIVRYLDFSLSSPLSGDEPYYIGEVEYLSKYGLYPALTQGTSPLYSVFIYLPAKLFSISYVISARVLSILFYLLSCLVIAACFNDFKKINNAKYLALTFFAVICKIWLWKGLPDLICTFFILSSFLCAIRAKGNTMLFVAGILFFLAMAVKPVAIFMFPGMVLFVFLKMKMPDDYRVQVKKTGLFISGFLVCFFAYYYPGYSAYGKLMLEDKNHIYINETRVDNAHTWNELNNYFEIYKDVHKKPNKWAVSFDEVIEFKKNHPQVELNLSLIQFLKEYPSIWFHNTFEKIFFDLSMYSQSGLFFYKWTSVNTWIKSYSTIKVIACFIFLIFLWIERSFLKINFLLFIPFLAYFICLSAYCIPQLENNWLLCCLPFFSLPIDKFFCDKVNIFILLALQAAYLVIA